MLLLLYVISILTLHNQNIDFANVKISNQCACDLRLSCTFVVDTILNLPTPFNIILKYLNQHIPPKHLQASSCSYIRRLTNFCKFVCYKNNKEINVTYHVETKFSSTTPMIPHITLMLFPTTISA